MSQGMLVVEEAINRYSERKGSTLPRCAASTSMAPGRDTTYGQPVSDNRLERVFDELMASSDYAARRAEIQANRGPQPQARHRLSAGEIWDLLYEVDPQSSGRPCPRVRRGERS